MNPTLPEDISFNLLKENGLKLSDHDFGVMIKSVMQGVNNARKYLQTETDPPPKFVFSDTISAIGYAHETDAINIRMDYLNLVAINTTKIEYRDQLVCFVPDKFYMILKYLSWMRLFGIEETIHYYQRHGNPKVHVSFPEKFPENLSPKSLLLSDLEVEARTTVDKINEANNENSIWQNVDEFFSKNYSDYYNKPIDHLAALPKPDLPISFEMENLLI